MKDRILEVLKKDSQTMAEAVFEVAYGKNRESEIAKKCQEVIKRWWLPKIGKDITFITGMEIHVGKNHPSSKPLVIYNKENTVLESNELRSGRLKRVKT